MALREFTRLTERLLARMGEEALLRGTAPCRAHVEHDVEMQGEQGEVAFTRTVATMLKTLAPKVGDALEIGTTIATVWTPDVEYVIDSPPFQDNGYSVRVVVRVAPPPPPPPAPAAAAPVMAKSFDILFAFKDAEKFAGKLDGITPEDLGRPVIDVVNDVARDTRRDSIRVMLRSLNLAESYVDDKMLLRPATNPVKPRAVIVGEGKRITNLERYFRNGGSQLTRPVSWPNEGSRPSGPVRGVSLPFVPRIGAAHLGIPAGKKQAGLRIPVKVGTGSIFPNAFLIRPKKTPGVVLIATRSKGDNTGKGKVRTLVGPSVYQMFNAALTPDFLSNVEDALAKNVLEKSSAALKVALT